MQTLTLEQLPYGKRATITALLPEAHTFRHKLLAMGITPGCQVTVIRSAPLGDPLQIEIRGFHLCLRRSEAATIQVEVCE